MRSHKRIRATVIAIGVLALVGIGGSAVAHWTAGGTGTGAASTGTVTALTLSPGTPATALFPGGAGDVTLVATNANATPVTVTSLALDPTQGTLGFAVDTDHGGCDLSVLAFATQSNGGAGWTVPARTDVDGTLAITLPGAVTMSLAAANACQGASFSVYLVAGS